MIRIKVITFALLLSIFSTPLFATSVSKESAKVEKQYEEIKKENWKVVASDPMTYFDESQWVLDGEHGVVRGTNDGIVVSAGPMLNNDSDHIVLWNRHHFEGDLRVEYDYTRIDNSVQGSVNIIYLHAQGSQVEPYTRDIMEWNNLRTIPAMRLYFNNMKLYHISYAVTDRTKDSEKISDYVRARQYIPGASTGNSGLLNTDLKPEYLDTDLFKVGQTYHITVTLRHDRLYMEVEGKTTKAHKLMWFDINPDLRLNDGYIGLRQMWGRTSRYSKFKVLQIEN